MGYVAQLADSKYADQHLVTITFLYILSKLVNPFANAYRCLRTSELCFHGMTSNLSRLDVDF